MDIIAAVFPLSLPLQRATWIIVGNETDKCVHRKCEHSGNTTQSTNFGGACGVFRPVLHPWPQLWAFSYRLNAVELIFNGEKQVMKSSLDAFEASDKDGGLLGRKNLTSGC